MHDLTGSYIPQPHGMIGASARQQVRHGIGLKEQRIDRMGVAQQCAQVAATADLPQMNRAIAPPAGQQRAIGRDCQTIDFPWMFLQHVDDLTGVRIPHPNGLVATAASQERAIWAKNHCSQPTAMPLQGV